MVFPCHGGLQPPFITPVLLVVLLVINPSFLVGRCGHGVFGRSLVGVVGVLFHGGIFFCMLWLVVMVVWWGRRNWWDGSAQSQTTGLTLLPHHGSPRLKHSFLPPFENIVMDVAKSFYHRMFSQRTIRGWSRDLFGNFLYKENWKTRVFTFQNTFFPRPDIGKHVLRK